MNESPGRMSRPWRSITAATLAPIEPRCTGMCGALATRFASPSKIAQEKSSRSLMLTELAVCRSTTPICSATCMKSPLNTSRRSGETVSGSAEGRAGGAALRSSSSPPWRTLARQPGSTTVVLVGSQTTAGPSTTAAGGRSVRTYTGASRAASAGEDPGGLPRRGEGCGTAPRARTDPALTGAPWVAAASAPAPAPTASVETASSVSARPGMRKP